MKKVKDEKENYRLIFCYIKVPLKRTVIWPIVCEARKKEAS